MVVGKLDSHMQKNETGPLSYTIHRNQVKWIKHLNEKPTTIKLLEEKRVSSLTWVLDLKPKAKATKAKKQVGLHRTKKHLHSKGNAIMVIIFQYIKCKCCIP